MTCPLEATRLKRYLPVEPFFSTNLLAMGFSLLWIHLRRPPLPGRFLAGGYACVCAAWRAGGASSLVQLGHRLALAGMSVKQSGQVLVAGEGEAGERWKRSTMRLTGLMTRKNTAAPMMSRVIARLMKSP